MAKMDKFFIFVGRASSVLLILAILGIAGMLVWVTLESHQGQPRGAVKMPDVAGGKAKPILLSFERLENIKGANTEMIHLTAQPESQQFSSGGYRNETRNILFLTGDEKAARWLFKDHRNLIILSEQLRNQSIKSEDTPASALYFEFISDDTNGDGSLSFTDHSNIGLTKPDGTGFVEILHDVNRVLSYEMMDNQHLSIVYQKDAVVRHAKFLISNFTLITDQEIIKL